MKSKILVVTDTGNDLSEAIAASCENTETVDFRHLGEIPLENYEAIALLAGNQDEPVTLDAVSRNNVERFRGNGGRLFCEFISSIGPIYGGAPERLVHHRSVFTGETPAEGLRAGDLFDTRYNECVKYYFRPEVIQTVLVSHPYIIAHAHTELPAAVLLRGEPSLWFLDGNTLICAMRISNYNKARLAPTAHWQALIEYLLGWLAGTAVKAVLPEPVCEHDGSQSLDECVRRGLAWFKNAGMLVEGGARGAREGFSHNIDAKDGRQFMASQIRNDCCGETGGAFMLDWLLNSNAESKTTAEALEDFCFNHMQVKEGLYQGMIRWSQTAWETCYQDDVARAIMPTLMKACLSKETGSRRRLDDAYEALDFLVKTTGTDGLRPNRTDCCHLSADDMEAIRSKPGGNPSAHYNAYYHAALLLAFESGGRQEYYDTARKGLETIMAAYPTTMREQSETQELCRLVLPLACLYKAGGEEKHKDMLYRVTADLGRLRHPTGGYAEWDTGYKAHCSRREAGECSLLAENGDPVADLLYSVNWLPLGFAWAYYATGDGMFYTLWEDVARFLRLAQIQSEDRRLDGAWARAFDMERREIYGVPHDVGWAPCSIESGWTVGEILTGLMIMKLLV